MKENQKISKKLNTLKEKLHDVESKKLNFNQKINLWIQEIGNFSSVDRVYVYFFREDENGNIIADNTHEWCGKNIPSVKEDQQNIPIDLFPFYKSLVYDGKEIARINSINDLSSEAQSMAELMKFQGLKSILALPIIKETNPIGFIGYETVKKEKEWKDDDQTALVLVAKLIASNS